jgi:hypothetical protein
VFSCIVLVFIDQVLWQLVCLMSIFLINFCLIAWLCPFKNKFQNIFKLIGDLSIIIFIIIIYLGEIKYQKLLENEYGITNKEDINNFLAVG